ncbi:DUF3987 domain-containing protein [Paraburkholderia fungorum]|uniref:DUF3987 domain-containing protein n=1 Tax=Paraburkholderia fungorum TaxID=134537 RepID=UPI0038B91CBD
MTKFINKIKAFRPKVVVLADLLHPSTFAMHFVPAASRKVSLLTGLLFPGVTGSDEYTSFTDDLSAGDHERTFAVSTGQGNRGRITKIERMDVASLFKRVTTPLDARVKHADYLELSRAKQQKLKGSDAFIVPGVFSDNKRDAQHIESRSALTLDVDHQAAEIFRRLEEASLTGGVVPFAYAYHTTRSHTDENPRIRLVVPLLRDVTPEEYPRCVWALKERFALPEIDMGSLEPFRLMYLPVQREGPFYSDAQPGPLVDPCELLAECLAVPGIAARARERKGADFTRDDLDQALMDDLLEDDEKRDELVEHLGGALDALAANYNREAKNYLDWEPRLENLKSMGEVGRGLALAFSERLYDWDGDLDEFDRKWQYDVKGTRSGYRSVLAKAQELGWHNPKSNTPRSVPATEAETERVKALLDAPEAREYTPANICPPAFPGAMAALVDIALRHQHRPQPLMTIGAALAAMSACLHGRYAFGGTRGNLYVVGLAGTGAGKSGPLDLVKMVVEAAGGRSLSNVGSGQGVEDAVRRSKERRASFVVDEVAHMIGAFSSSKATDYQAAAGKILLEMFSASGGTMTTRVLADENKQPVLMFNPYVTLFGVTTHAKMKGISPGLIEDGTLGRCLVVSGEDFVDAVETAGGSPYEEVKEAVGERARAVYDFGEQMTERDQGVATLQASREAKEAENVARLAFDGIAKNSDGAKRALCMRALEQVKRIALVLAVWDGADKVGQEHIEWGVRFVRYSHECLLAFVETMTDSPVVANARVLEAIMRDAVGGKKPFTGLRFHKWNEVAHKEGLVQHGALLKKSRLDSMQVRQAITHLASEGAIEIVTSNTGATREASMFYRLTD